MAPSHDSIVPTFRCSSSWLFRGISLLIAACTLSASLPAQSDKALNKDRKRGGSQDDSNSGRKSFDPAAMQGRMLDVLREQFGVTDDAEWTLIAERITKVAELRRSTAASGFGFRGAADSKGRSSARPGSTGNPEQDALRAALKDQLPDAEIKARLTRLRETRKKNEAKLATAQEELRAVLSIRQEAVAVMAQLLP